MYQQHELHDEWLGLTGLEELEPEHSRRIAVQQHVERQPRMVEKGTGLEAVQDRGVLGIRCVINGACDQERRSRQNPDIALQAHTRQRSTTHECPPV